MHAYMNADTNVFIYPYVRLSVCMSVCMYVCMYVCVRDKLEQSVHAVKNIRLYWHQNPGSL